MTIAITLKRYLDDQGVDYEVVTHRPTMTSSRTAQASHVSGECLAKAVVVKDEDDFMVAVLPASHHIQLGELRRLLDRQVGLATEEEASALFPDCEFGAFPAMAAAYGETSTNLMQPFFMLTVLPIMAAGVRVQARDVMGYLVLPFLCCYLFTAILVYALPL